MPLGTSMDCESERSRQLQCWNGPAIVTGFVNQWTSDIATPDFEPDDGYCDALIDIGLNECSSEQRAFWRKTMKDNYRGDDGRRRIRMAGINLAERGGLHLRVSDVRCPVLWLHVRSCLTISPRAQLTRYRGLRMPCSPWPMPWKKFNSLLIHQMHAWCQ